MHSDCGDYLRDRSRRQRGCWRGCVRSCVYVTIAVVTMRQQRDTVKALGFSLYIFAILVAISVGILAYLKWAGRI